MSDAPRYKLNIWGDNFYTKMWYLINDIRLRPGYSFELKYGPSNTDVYVVLAVQRPEARSGEVMTGRTWRVQLWPSMSETQIVETLFELTLQYERHEAREAFIYKGKRPFGPHIDILARLSVAEQFEGRDSGPSTWSPPSARLAEIEDNPLMFFETDQEGWHNV